MCIINSYHLFLLKTYNRKNYLYGYTLTPSQVPGILFLGIYSFGWSQICQRHGTYPASFHSHAIGRRQLPVGPHVKPYSLKWLLLTRKGSRLEKQGRSLESWGRFTGQVLSSREARKTLGTQGKRKADSTKGKERLGSNRHLSSGTKVICSKTKPGEAHGAGTVRPSPLEGVLFLASVSDTAPCWFRG